MIFWSKMPLAPAAIVSIGLAGVLALAAGGPIAPVAAQDSGLATLNALARGEWTVRYRNGSGPDKLCVRSGEELIKLRHRGRNCSRFVVEEGANRVTVQYTCRGDGYGRTSIRSENNALVQIESQGIAGGQPFRFSAEARRTGGC